MIQTIQEICSFASTSSLYVFIFFSYSLIFWEYTRSTSTSRKSKASFYFTLILLILTPIFKCLHFCSLKIYSKIHLQKRLPWLPSKEVKLLSVMHNWMMNREMIMSKVNLISSLFRLLTLWYRAPQISTEIPCDLHVSISDSVHTYQVKLFSTPKGQHIVFHRGIQLIE